MVKLRKGPVCPGTTSDGSTCGARVDRPGERCQPCLERLVSSPDVDCRRRLAADGGLPSFVFEVLGTDTDDAVRLAVARSADCPLVVLQELEHDAHQGVRDAAAAALYSAFRPRVLHSHDSDNLFTADELDELGRQGSGASPDPFGPPAYRPPSSGPPSSELPSSRPPAIGSPLSPPPALDRRGGDGPAAALPPDPRPVPGAGGAPPPALPSPAGAPALPASAVGADDPLRTGLDAVLGRLEAVATRLSSLETVLASAGARLHAISERLDDLAVLSDAGTGAGPSEGSLLPVVHPAELGTGPEIRADLVASAWLAVLPVLARQRARGQRGAPVAAMAVPADTVAGPFTEPTAVAVAELLPGPAATGHDRTGRPWRDARGLRRRYVVHTRRHGPHH